MKNHTEKKLKKALNNLLKLLKGLNAPLKILLRDLGEVYGGIFSTVISAACVKKKKLDIFKACFFI
jgi:hypothetical protein